MVVDNLDSTEIIDTSCVKKAAKLLEASFYIYPCICNGDKAITDIDLKFKFNYYPYSGGPAAVNRSFNHTNHFCAR